MDLINQAETGKRGRSPGHSTVSLFKRRNMNANEKFEQLAEEFYQKTHLMAPGKDDMFSSVTYEKRIEEWDKFLKEKFSKD